MFIFHTINFDRPSYRVETEVRMASTISGSVIGISANEPSEAHLGMVVAIDPELAAK